MGWGTMSCLNGDSTSVFVILSCTKSTATWSTPSRIVVEAEGSVSRSTQTMYFTGRAGSILRYDTRSGGGGEVEGSRGGWNGLAPTSAPTTRSRGAHSGRANIPRGARSAGFVF